MKDLMQLPPDLPVPVDDGACAHLPGRTMPAVALLSTGGRRVDLSALSARRTVVYCYPRTGVPGEASPTGWDGIPGARGCTPQSCAFRDHQQELAELGTDLFGLSTQTHEAQCEAAARLHLGFELLSDAGFALCDALHLPTFTVDGLRLVKRLTLLLRDGRIERVFYPVFPPDRNASDVVRWLQAHPL